MRCSSAQRGPTGCAWGSTPGVSTGSRKWRRGVRDIRCAYPSVRDEQSLAFDARIWVRGWRAAKRSGLLLLVLPMRVMREGASKRGAAANRHV